MDKFLLYHTSLRFTISLRFNTANKDFSSREIEMLWTEIDWTMSNWTNFNLAFLISHFSIINLQKIRF